MLGDRVRVLRGHLQPRGASPPCGDSAFEATVQRRDRTFPGQDRSGPASLAIGGGPGLYKPSGLRGMFIGFVIVELLILLCTYCCCVYIFLCTCRRLYRSRHLSKSPRTSSGMLRYARRSGKSPPWPLAASWCLPSLR